MASILELASLITKELESYSEDVSNVVKDAVDTVGKETNEEIKKHITFKKHRGKYVKSFRVKRLFENKYGKTVIWYVSDGEYRLTHLLEHGHALNNGGRAQAYPHIKYGEELAQRRMEELVLEGIEDVNRR